MSLKRSKKRKKPLLLQRNVDRSWLRTASPFIRVHCDFRPHRSGHLTQAYNAERDGGTSDDEHPDSHHKHRENNGSETFGSDSNNDGDRATPTTSLSMASSVPHRTQKVDDVTGLSRSATPFSNIYLMLAMSWFQLRFP